MAESYSTLKRNLADAFILVNSPNQRSMRFSQLQLGARSA